MARVGRPLALNTGGQVPGCSVIVEGERYIVQADVHVAAAACPLGVEHGCHERQRRHHAAGIVGERETTLDRRAARITGQCRPAGLGLDQRVVSWLAAAITVAAIG